MSPARTTILLSFGLLLCLAPQMTFPAALPQISASLGLSAGEAGWVGSIFFGGYAAAIPIFSGATDRMDGRWIYIGNAAVGAAASIGFAFLANDFYSAMLFRFLGGVAFAGMNMPGLKLLADHVTGPAQRRSTSLYASTYAAGSGTSLLLAGALVETLGWEGVFVVAGLGPAIAGLLVLVFLPRPPKRPPSASAEGPRTLLRNRELLLYVTAFAGNTWEVFAIRVWFVGYLAWLAVHSGDAISASSLAMIGGLAVIAGVPVSLGVSELASRFGRRRVIVLVDLFSVSVCLALAALADGPLLACLLLAALLQITSFADVGILSNGAVAAANPSQRGAALGLYGFVGFVSGTLGGVVVGLVVEWVAAGYGMAAAWSAGFLVMALGSTVAVLAISQIRQTPP